MNISGGYFFQKLPISKRRRTEHTQFKNKSKTKKNTNSKPYKIRITHNIQGRKNVKLNAKIWLSEWQENKGLTKEIAFCKNCCFLLKYV